MYDGHSLKAGRSDIFDEGAEKVAFFLYNVFKFPENTCRECVHAGREGKGKEIVGVFFV